MGTSALDILAREHEDLRDSFGRVRDPDADRTAAWLETVKQVTTHVAVERTFVYPLIRGRGLGSAHLQEELRRDYKRMEHLLVVSERRKINSPDMPELVTELLEVFEAHRTAAPASWSRQCAISWAPLSLRS